MALGLLAFVVYLTADVPHPKDLGNRITSTNHKAADFAAIQFVKSSQSRGEDLFTLLLNLADKIGIFGQVAIF